MKSPPKGKYYEVVDRATGHSYGAVKAKSGKHAANIMSKSNPLSSGDFTVYPAKITKKKGSTASVWL